MAPMATIRGEKVHSPSLERPLPRSLPLVRDPRSAEAAAATARQAAHDAFGAVSVVALSAAVARQAAHEAFSGAASQHPTEERFDATASVAALAPAARHVPALLLRSTAAALTAAAARHAAHEALRGASIMALWTTASQSLALLVGDAMAALIAAAARHAAHEALLSVGLPSASRAASWLAARLASVAICGPAIAAKGGEPR